VLCGGGSRKNGSLLEKKKNGEKNIFVLKHKSIKIKINKFLYFKNKRNMRYKENMS
jgi:hypothetical protein